MHLALGTVCCSHYKTVSLIKYLGPKHASRKYDHQFSLDLSGSKTTTTITDKDISNDLSKSNLFGLKTRGPKGLYRSPEF